MSGYAAIGALLSLPALWAGMAQADSATPITLPSGAVAHWHETLHDDAGGPGLTYRFRFVVPDLASHLPLAEGSDPDDEADGARAPLDIDTESGEVLGEDDAEDAEALAGDAAGDMDEGDEEAADALLEEPAPPADPDLLAQDPVHGDVAWLCEHWALPRIADAAPRPRQIVISLASRETPFGSFDPAVVQLFEAFRLPPDRDACEWEPW